MIGIFRRHRAELARLRAHLELANERAAVMDRCMGEDSQTIARQQLVIGKQKEQIDALLEQLKQQKKGTPGDGKAND